MVKHSKYCFVIFILFIVGTKMHAGEKQSAEYVKYVNEITDSFVKEMEKELDLKCIGKGGSMPNNVKEIEVVFIASRKATIQEARELEVKATEKLLHAINTHEKIRPYLSEYPFQANRAEISIAFRTPDNSCYTDGSVVHVYQVNNKIFYDAEDALSHKRFSLGIEPYEEAKKHVPKMLTNPIYHPL